MESCLWGKPVISYQPDLRFADPLPSNRLGWSRAVYRRAELQAALDAELFDPCARADRMRLLAKIPRLTGATERVVTLLTTNGTGTSNE